MKLREINNLLADNLKECSIDIKGEEKEYTLNFFDQDPETLLFYAMYPEENEPFNFLSQKEIAYIYIAEGGNGFGVALKDATPEEFISLSKNYNIPLTVKDYKDKDGE